MPTRPSRAHADSRPPPLPQASLTLPHHPPFPRIPQRRPAAQAPRRIFLRVRACPCAHAGSTESSCRSSVPYHPPVPGFPARSPRREGLPAYRRFPHNENASVRREAAFPGASGLFSASFSAVTKCSSYRSPLRAWRGKTPPPCPFRRSARRGAP